MIIVIWDEVFKNQREMNLASRPFGFAQQYEYG